ncbi:hypothetical protein ASD18_19780 [Cellulomonas sp. Root137]|nr:hypothetical protein ASD18_19780 [Cellulomonas sp. Root137]
MHVSELRNGRMTRARLVARGTQLAALLASAGSGADITCEEPLADASRLLWGIPDIVVRGSRTMVLDLKTGADAATDVSESVRLQLLLYSHLFRFTYGALPAVTAAFSLAHGLIEIPAQPEAVDLAVESVIAARHATGARPSPEGCRHCPRRFACESHWAAVHEGDLADALEGVISESATAESGLIALRISSQASKHLVTGISDETIRGDVAVGSHVRIVRALQLSSSERQAMWRGGKTTAVEVDPLG